MKSERGKWPNIADHETWDLDWELSVHSRAELSPNFPAQLFPFEQIRDIWWQSFSSDLCAKIDWELSWIKTFNFLWRFDSVKLKSGEAGCNISEVRPGQELPGTDLRIKQQVQEDIPRWRKLSKHCKVSVPVCPSVSQPRCQVTEQFLLDVPGAGLYFWMFTFLKIIDNCCPALSLSNLGDDNYVLDNWHREPHLTLAGNTPDKSSGPHKI